MLVRLFFKPISRVSSLKTFNKSRMPCHIKSAAIILSGSGVADGSEITEAVSLLVSLDRLGAPFQCYAPNKSQKDVINHLTGENSQETRNVLVESARICRGNVKSLELLLQQNHDALFLPGGFGAAKNLSDFAEKGNEFTVDPEVEKILLAFAEQGKPVGAACISPILLAKVFGNKKVKLTLGKKEPEWEYSSTMDLAQQFGAEVQEKKVNTVCLDENLKIATTPAFMKGTAGFFEVFEGINRMVMRVNAFLDPEKQGIVRKKRISAKKPEENIKFF